MGVTTSTWHATRPLIVKEAAGSAITDEDVGLLPLKRPLGLVTPAAPVRVARIVSMQPRADMHRIPSVAYTAAIFTTHPLLLPYNRQPMFHRAFPPGGTALTDARPADGDLPHIPKKVRGRLSAAMTSHALLLHAYRPPYACWMPRTCAPAMPPTGRATGRAPAPSAG